MNFILRRKGYGSISCAGIAEKYLELYDDEVPVVRSDQGIPDPEGSYVWRWGCTATVPGSKKIINKSKAIHRVYNKKTFRCLLSEKGLSPKSWDNYGDWWFCAPCNESWVIRKNFHKQGKNLHLCESAHQVYTACSLYDDYYISEYIKKVAEYRVVIMSGRILYMYEKIPEDPDDIAWNHAQGGSMDNVKWSQWPLNVAKCALESFALSGLDLGAVDIMTDKDGRAYCLEINTAPETTSPYRQTCIAKGLRYIHENGRDHIPTLYGYVGWKGLIHPCISELAKV